MLLRQYLQPLLLANLVGLVIGAVTNLAMSWTWPVEAEKGVISLNPLTNPGWLMFFSVLMVCTFREPPLLSEYDIVDESTEPLLFEETDWKTVNWNLF